MVNYASGMLEVGILHLMLEHAHKSQVVLSFLHRYSLMTDLGPFLFAKQVELKQLPEMPVETQLKE